MVKFAEFILSTFKGRLVLFVLVVATAWAAKLLGA
jgi:hypothetical protein